MPLFDFLCLAAVQSLSLYLISALSRLLQTLEPLVRLSCRLTHGEQRKRANLGSIIGAISDAGLTPKL